MASESTKGARGLISTDLPTNALVIGSGGREHAIAWKLGQSDQIDRVFVAPGNGGTFELNVPISSEDVEQLYDFALKNHCYTVVGPEAPLARGIVDRFTQGGLEIFGPTASQAMLETSKSFAKEFMVSNAIPTADFGIFEASQEAIDFAHRFDGRVAVKVDGLAGGKGVFVCGSIEEAETAIKNILNERAFGEAGRKIVVEERLVGRECTVMTICNGRRAFFFGTARDHKRAFDNDQGPNTGGMGAFSEANTIDERAISRITQEIAGPCVSRLGFRGFLYLGLMITDEGPKVLEFNARLGDPEAQAILPRLETDLMTTMLMMKDSDVNPELKWSKDQCCAVVMCSEGYPGSPKTGDLITGLNDAGRIEKTLVFHSGTRRSGGSFFTAGGRVLTVTGQGGTIDLASQRAYSAIESISWPGEHHRKDIGRLS